LARVERRAKEDGFSEQTIAALLKAATDAHFELEQSGRLDWKPTEEEIIKQRGHAPKVERAETRLEMDEIAPGVEYNKTLAEIGMAALLAVDLRLDELKLDWYYVKQHYYAWIDRLIPIAEKHGADSPEWQAEVDATAPKLHDPALAREAAAIVAKTFNQWKVKLPPKPTTG
jgi:hypothetical protein